MPLVFRRAGLGCCRLLGPLLRFERALLCLLGAGPRLAHHHHQQRHEQQGEQPSRGEQHGFERDGIVGENEENTIHQRILSDSVADLFYALRLTPAKEIPYSAVHRIEGPSRMAKRPILILPDERLRAIAEPIEKIDDGIKQLAKDMLETMYDAPGIGLAAPQIGELKRIVVMDLAKEGEKPDPLVMINPEILSYSDEVITTEEGCLSIPELYYDVDRPAEVTVKYTDLDGKDIELHAKERLAICVQHELDHLDGVLYIDYLSRLKRDRVLKKFQKQARRAG